MDRIPVDASILSPHLYEMNQSHIGHGTIYAHYFMERVPGLLPFAGSAKDGRLNALPGKESLVALTVWDASGNNSSVEFHMEADPALYTSSHPAPYLVRRSNKNVLQSDSGKCRLTIPGDAILSHRDYFIVRESKSPVLPDHITYQSPLYSILPEDKDFIEPIQVAIQAEKGEGVGLYLISRYKDAPVFISDHRVDGYYVGQVRTTGRFAILKDASTPDWYVPRRKNYREDDKIRLYPSDTGSGIDLRTLEITVDGVKPLWEYDIDHHGIEIFWPETLHKIGTHHVRSQYKDKAGNLSKPLVWKYRVNKSFHHR